MAEKQESKVKVEETKSYSTDEQGEGTQDEAGDAGQTTEQGVTGQAEPSQPVNETGPDGSGTYQGTEHE